MMMFNRGFIGHGGCFGYGFFNTGGSHYLMLLGVALVVAAIILFVKHKKNDAKEDQTLALLKTKFVQGEITEEEYLNRKNVLKRK